MSLKKWKTLLASCAFAGALALVSGGCSSGSGATSDGGGAGGGDDGSGGEASHPPPRHVDGSPGGPETGTTVDSGNDSSTGGFDGTTGKSCATDAECDPLGLGMSGNACSIINFFTGGPIYPTPVCLPIQPCDPGTDNLIHYCDGPDVPTSPGVCLPVQAGGLCVPQCSILSDASAPTGCQGKDRCNVFGSGLRNGQPFSVGFCFGGCAADADCPQGSVCQKDEGVCLTTPLTRTKQLGQTCSVNDPTGACNCFQNNTTGVGYCTQFCIVGASSTAPCPSGYVCDAELPAVITNSVTDASVPGFTMQNAGLAGSCLQACGPTAASDAGSSPSSDAAADASVDASSASGSDAASQGVAMCPATASCAMDHTAGPVCFP
jgi:hypothetical protein